MSYEVRGADGNVHCRARASELPLPGFLILHYENPIPTNARCLDAIHENHVFPVSDQKKLRGGTTDGNVFAFESRGNDSWVQVWHDSLEIFEAYSTAGGLDTDGNGRQEVFVSGSPVNPGAGWTSVVLEMVADDTPVRVVTLEVSDSVHGSPLAVLAEVDGSGDE